MIILSQPLRPVCVLFDPRSPESRSPFLAIYCERAVGTAVSTCRQPWARIRSPTNIILTHKPHYTVSHHITSSVPGNNPTPHPNGPVVAGHDLQRVPKRRACSPFSPVPRSLSGISVPSLTLDVDCGLTNFGVCGRCFVEA